VNNCWLTQAEPLTHWLTAFKLKNNSRSVRDSSHEEQPDAPERRNQAKRQWKINRRRSVIGDVRIINGVSSILYWKERNKN
jgi:hypothetical protein